MIADIEDFHPEEEIAHKNEHEKQKRTYLFNHILPKIDFLTFASPLIMDYSQKLIGQKVINHVLINNSFESKDFSFTPVGSEKLTLVWFSQTIDYGRGLEVFIPILHEFKDQIELTLIGNLRPNFKQNFLDAYSDFVETIPPLPQQKLHELICEFDIGLAIETKLADLNRDICLTNKLFAYAQSGLYILASHTQAQNLFISDHPTFGILARNEINDIRNKCIEIIQCKQQIRALKKARFECAKKLAWEVEILKVERLWEMATNKKPAQ